MALIKQDIFDDLDLSLTPVLKHLETLTTTIEADVVTLKNTSTSATPNLLPGATMATDALERKLTAKIEALTHKIDSKAVHIGSYVFTSLDHCVAFATKCVPQGEFQ